MFNVINLAHNHAMDRGYQALLGIMDFFDCFAKGSYPALQGDKKGMNPETNTLPKQHTSSLQGEVVDYHKVMYLGVFRSEEARRERRTIEKNGIRVGFLAYTFSLNGFRRINVDTLLKKTNSYGTKIDKKTFFK